VDFRPSVRWANRYSRKTYRLTKEFRPNLDLLRVALKTDSAKLRYKRILQSKNVAGYTVRRDFSVAGEVAVKGDILKYS
jgi:hypothetical protein